MHYIIQHYVQLSHHAKRKGMCHRNLGNVSKVSVGHIVGVSSGNLKIHCKYFEQKENSNYHVNSRELSFRDQTPS